MSDRFMLRGFVALAVTVISAACSSPQQQAAPPGQSTELEIEISGGFAYVPTPADGTLEIAYLNDIVVTEGGAEVCNVDQIGTQLKVVRGTISEFQPPNLLPESREFDLDKSVVKFPKLESANIPLSMPRGNWPPNPLKPVPHTAQASWKNLQYVPRITEHAPLTNRTIKRTWRNDKNVNGRLVLKGGTLEATMPTDPIAQMAQFEFKVGGQSRGLVASTDKTIYRVTVPSDQVEILFTGSAKGYQRLVLKPDSPGEPVRLRLRGLHNMSSPASLRDGDELKDFCAFHTLLEPPVNSSDYVRIYYKAPAQTGGPGQPSPGFFCDPNLF